MKHKIQTKTEFLPDSEHTFSYLKANRLTVPDK